MRSNAIGAIALIVGIIVGIIGAVFIEEVFEEEEVGAGKVLDQPFHPVIIPSDFVDGINHTFMPLIIGQKMMYEGETAEGFEHIEIEVLNETKVVMGVICMVVRDTVSVDGEVAEDTYDWFARDNMGNVWYFGEDSREMEGGEIVSRAGSWEAGVDGALPGILIPAFPLSGITYRQEYYEGEAEDMATVIRLDETVTVEYGTYQNCLKTFEWNPLEGGAGEYKYYAPGVGMILEGPTDGSERIELIEIQHN